MIRKDAHLVPVTALIERMRVARARSTWRLPTAVLLSGDVHDRLLAEVSPLLRYPVPGSGLGRAVITQILGLEVQHASGFGILKVK